MDIETGNPVTPATLFVAGSISKPVTIMGALRLVQEQKLSLDRNINDFLTSWKLPDNDLTKGHPVTLRLLASHNGGTTVHGFRGYAEGEPVPTIVQILDGDSPANSAPIRVDLTPGTVWRYSGGGVTIVQLAMSEAEHRSFQELMSDKVLEPIGMTSSSYEQNLSTDRRSLAATGHDGAGKVVQGKRFKYPEMAAAGLWTTPTDLAKFAIEAGLSAQGKSNKVLRTLLARLMVTPRLAIEGTDSMALGFFLERHGGAVYYGHGGEDMGFIAQLVAHREGGYGAAIMTNAEGRAADLIDEILRSIAREYGWQGYVPPAVETIALTPLALDALAGRYRIGSDNVLDVRRDGDHLLGKETESEAYPLLPVTPVEFVRTDREAKYTFSTKENGAGVVVVSRQRGSDSAARITDGFTVPLERLNEGKIQEAIDGYRSIRQHDAKDRAVDEGRLNSLGYRFLRQKNYDAAIAVFGLNVEFYPDSWNVYDSLGEGYMNQGDRERAIENYQRSLQLNPKNTNGERMLEKIRGMK